MSNILSIDGKKVPTEYIVTAQVMVRVTAMDQQQAATVVQRHLSVGASILPGMIGVVFNAEPLTESLLQEMGLAANPKRD